MKNTRIDILSRPLFTLSLGILLLNDFYLKYEYSNWMTGKLSDFAGLFIFPLFLSSFRIKWSKSIYLGTALLFIFWKSPLSQDIIEWAQNIGIGFNRTVDYSDLLALSILPISFYYLQHQRASNAKHNFLAIPIGLLSLFAIWATTLPREEVELNMPINKVYELGISKKQLFNSLHFANSNSNNIEKNLADSLFYIYFDIQEEYQADVTVLVKITSIDSTHTMIQLDTIISCYLTGSLFSGVDKQEVEYFQSLSELEFARYFDQCFIKSVKNGDFENLYYDNKDNDDERN
ncbi:MAG: hypothetical protein RLO81_12505 [Fulvivirga sp.]|uniref:hypothetical protein n=1 Tax=Fulvivirga sp. TaxID=1931237 RepID=UPI0032EF7A5F